MLCSKRFEVLSAIRKAGSTLIGDAANICGFPFPKAEAAYLPSLGKCPDQSARLQNVWGHLWQEGDSCIAKALV